MFSCFYKGNKIKSHKIRLHPTTPKDMDQTPPVGLRTSNCSACERHHTQNRLRGFNSNWRLRPAQRFECWCIDTALRVKGKVRGVWLLILLAALCWASFKPWHAVRPCSSPKSGVSISASVTHSWRDGPQRWGTEQPAVQVRPAPPFTAQNRFLDSGPCCCFFAWWMDMEKRFASTLRYNPHRPQLLHN